MPHSTDKSTATARLGQKENHRTGNVRRYATFEKNKVQMASVVIVGPTTLSVSLRTDRCHVDELGGERILKRWQ
ncbi:unnamed protein product [Leptosia nina]|uniref:Uncharacterized protein n=1 Tax=Leptosia nina TaxID=320188 RepID=A0AAV1JDM4_9NEOP